MENTKHAYTFRPNEFEDRVIQAIMKDFGITGSRAIGVAIRAYAKANGINEDVATKRDDSQDKK